MPKHALRTHSLTVMPCVKELTGDVHYGILNGSYNMYSDKFGKITVLSLINDRITFLSLTTELNTYFLVIGIISSNASVGDTLYKPTKRYGNVYEII